MHLKLPQTESFKKHKKQLVIWLAIELLIKLQELYFKFDKNYKSQELYHRIVEGQLEIK